MRPKIKIMWLGLRGFPGIQGGVEMHGEKLCPLLAELGCDVHVIVRSPYQPKEFGDTWHQVRFHRLWAPRSKSLEAIVHSTLGVLYAGLINRPEILHIQAVGPALVTPLARLLGLKVVVTHHGPDYERQKWGRIGRLSLQLGERLGMLWSNARIVISQGIANAVRTKYGRESTLIPNGATLPDRPEATDCIDSFGLERGKYVLLVSRLVPEKRHLDLIEAFNQAAVPGWKLALVGSSDHPDDYTRAVLGAAEATPNVVCTGFQTGAALAQLYTHAGVFVLPSSHEGLPIALLEALSYGLTAVASDIPANLEVDLPPENYFPLGDVETLAQRIVHFAAQPITAEEQVSRRDWVAQRYDWDDIAQKTASLYRQVVGRE